MNLRIAGIALSLLLLGLGIGHMLTADQNRAPELDRAEPDEALLARGAMVVAIAGCRSCHTGEHDGAPAFAGGRAIKTPFGNIYSPNITPDSATGIGDWSVNDLSNALRLGLSPSGQHYFPAFPYTSYAGMTDGDVQAVFAFLQSIKTEAATNEDSDLWPPFSWRYLQRYWKWLYFVPSVPGAKEAELERGTYLVEVLGHCGECHTPRDLLGGLLNGQRMAGSRASGSLAPNITPHMAEGLGQWSEAGWTFFLKSGFKPDFDNVQGKMAVVIREGTAQLSDADRALMAVYLRSLAERPSYDK